MNVKLFMFIASVLGALTGANLIIAVQPGMNFFYWIGAFAILGVGAGNLILLVLYKIYRWLNTEAK